MLNKVIKLLTLTIDRRVVDDTRDQRIAELHEMLRSEPPNVLVCRLGLNELEVQVAYLLAAIAVDANVRRLLAAFEQTTSGDPTLATIARLVYGPGRGRRELSAPGRLRALRVIERSDNGGPDLHEHLRTWTIAPRMLELFQGELELDPTLGASIPAVPALGALAIEPSPRRGWRGRPHQHRALGG